MALMNNPNRMVSVSLLLIVAALIVAGLLVVSVSVALLPPPPAAATPTWPQGITLPDKLPRFQE